MVQHGLGDQAGWTECDGSGWIGEVRMVEKVESIHSEIQVQVIPEMEPSAHRGIDFGQTESGNIVPAFGSLSNRRRWHRTPLPRSDVP